MHRVCVIAACLLILAGQTHAQTRPRADNYQMPSDVMPAGGGEDAKSTNYVLDDTIGEANVGFGRSDTYDLNAGYRQVDEYIALSCSDTVNLGTLTFTGQRTGSGTCLVVADSEAGYALSWRITTGSGGANTGYLISENEDAIAPFTPAVAGTPDTWSITSATSEWGARLRSTSTDPDVQWGTDGVSEKWLNVGTGSYTVSQRSSRTDPAGSTEIFQFRVEIGANKVQPPGTYQAEVVLTASSL